MDRGLKFIGLGVFAAFIGIVVNAAVKTAQASNTAEKLTIDYDGLKIKKVEYFAGFIPKGVIYSIYLKLNNPTNNELQVTNPYITLSIAGQNGASQRIANTQEASSTPILIKANANTKVDHDVEIRLANVLPHIPQFVDYVISRLRGQKATIKVIADISIEALGATISQTKPILI